MNLINDIIGILSSEKPDLTNALIKTKVLLHSLEQISLIKWVNCELTGYSTEDDLPSYRIMRSVIFGNIANTAYQITNQQIPLSHLPNETREKFVLLKFRESVSVLEDLASSKEEHIKLVFPVEYMALLNKGLANDYHVQDAWKAVSKTHLIQALTEIRSRLLDFMLELKKEFPEEITSDELKKKLHQIDSNSMFGNAIFGDNTTVVIGDSNRLQIVNRNSKGDFNELEKTLKKIRCFRR